MKKKGSIVVAILLLAIGFAAISTTLIINSSAKVSENTDDFSVIFTAATLDGTDVYANVISEDKKIITFETNDLKTLNQTSVLNYEVTNNSANYDAKVSVNCKIKDDGSAKYTSIKNELEGNATIVKAKETLNGTLTVTLNKTATEEVKEEYVCELTFNAIERDKEGYNGQTEWTFDYTGGEQTFTAPISGTYKIETWGAQGGVYNDQVASFGGYSVGNISLEKSNKLFVVVGGQGENEALSEESLQECKINQGGYNGGGNGTKGCNGANKAGGAGGGGATHIATISGLLSTLETKRNSILIVSGGGGGSAYNTYNEEGKTVLLGGNGGGFTGNLASQAGSCNNCRSKASQTSGYAFGKGADAVVEQTNAGGGGGFYGGYADDNLNDKGWVPGTGGSGYIGNSLLTEKVMYCYNCEESTEESTKTISTTCAESTPTENCAKSGNGYARITLIK